MSERKHTRGPWKVFPPGKIVGHSDRCVIKRDDAFDWVASVQLSNMPNWQENAELIASAPDMADKIERLEADLARVTAERDRLIERWPCDRVNLSDDELGYFAVSMTTGNGKAFNYNSRTAAVRFAAGLDEAE